MSGRRAPVGLLTGVIFLTIASVAIGGRATQRRLVDRVAARVNNEIITENELLMAAFAASDGVVGPDLRGTLKILVEDRLLAQEARLQIKEIPEERIANTVEAEIKARRNLFRSEKDFLAALEKRGWDLETYKDNLRRQEERRYLVQVALSRRVRTTPEEVEAYEQKRRREGKSVLQYRLRQIFLTLPPTASKTAVEKAQGRMLGLLEDIRRGVPFGDLVVKHSEDKAARRTGGDLGWMDSETMQPDIREAVQSLEVGKVSQPVRTAKGLHLFRLVAKRTPREMFRQKQLEDTRKEWVADLRRRGQIKILLSHLR